ncbi:MAG: ATP synthase subunit I [Firmicutes bacterium]|jgi:hypothetical protein|nr:ATP synthase subunit I [Bacillota bacterium]
MFNESHVLRTTVVFTILFSCVSLLGLGISVSLGILFGGLMSSLAFRLMIIDATTLLRRAAKGPMDRKDVQRHSWISFAKRNALYSATLIVAILNPSLSFLATLAGLLMPRIAILYHLIRGRISRGT